MKHATGARRRGSTLWSGVLAAVLLLGGGIAWAASADPAAWALDLLARMDAWRPVAPQDLLQNPASALPAAAQAQIQAGYGRLPMHFEPNRGQSAEAVRFLARGPGYTLFLTADEAVLALRPAAPVPDRRHRLSTLAALDPEPAALAEAAPPGAVVRMRLTGAARNPQPTLEGLEPLPGVSNYFLGNDPAQWRTVIPHYRRVRSPNVYPGIDLVYYGNPRQLEYDFVLAPGADPSVIRLAFQGVDGLRLSDNGDLYLRVAGGELVQKAPQVYQVVNGERRALAGRYVLAGGEQPDAVAFAPSAEHPEAVVGFQVAGHAPDQALVIDPVLVYSTYLGGSTDDYGYGIAVDGAGHAYVTGRTESADFPTVHVPYPNLGGYEDAFVAKLNANGAALVYATYLGGSESDSGNGIAVDGAGHAYVTGWTRSANFPTVHAPYPNFGGHEDAFVAKLNADGAALAYATYLGGGGSDSGHGIAVDGAGHAYVTGETDSADFPTVHAPYPNSRGYEDAFVAKLNADGAALVYATYLGGGGSDSGHGIAVDGAGHAYVTGWTRSADFPTVHAPYPNSRGYEDAFVAKLNADGAALAYATYLGGRRNDVGRGIAVDGAGHAYVTGWTGSDDFPTVHALYPNFRGGWNDTFVAKLNADGTALVYSTYLGGSWNDGGHGIAVDGAGHAYVTGWTGSADFPTVHAPYPNSRGHEDAFVAKLNADGTALVYSTYLGGSYVDIGSSIAVDGAGHAYVTGWTGSADFPTVHAPYPNLKGYYDAFVAKIAPNRGPDSAAGLYDPFAGAFFLRNGNSAGAADAAFFYGPADLGWRPVAGSWDGGITTTVGLYDPAAGVFYLKNSNSPGAADLVFRFGPTNAGWLPLVGDWDGNNTTTVGLYNPAAGAFFLKNSHSPGAADLAFRFGPANAGWLPLAGDWDGDGVATVGLYDPATGAFFLKNSHGPGAADIAFFYGPPNAGWLPLAGDWDGDGIATVGLYDPAAGVFYLKNSNSPGAADIVFRFGPTHAGWLPLVGNWNGSAR